MLRPMFATDIALASQATHVGCLALFRTSPRVIVGFAADCSEAQSSQRCCHEPKFMMEFTNSRSTIATFPTIPSCSSQRATPKFGVSSILLLCLIIFNLTLCQPNDDSFFSMVLATPGAAADFCSPHQLNSVFSFLISLRHSCTGGPLTNDEFSCCRFESLSGH